MVGALQGGHACWMGREWSSWAWSTRIRSDQSLSREYTDTQSVTRCCGRESFWGQGCSVFALWCLWELTHVMKLCRTTHTHRPRQALAARYPAHMHTDMHTCTSIHTHAQTSAHLPVECTVFASCLVFSTPIV